MKPKTIVAIVIVAATTMIMFSCNWFSAKTKTPYDKLAGTWRYDMDTAGNSLALFLWTLAKKDSTKVFIQFDKDSIFYIKEGAHITDSGRFVIDTAKAAFYVKSFAGAMDDSFRIERFSDSLLQFVTLDKDSTRIKLTR